MPGILSQLLLREIKESTLTLNLLFYRVLKYIGAYTAAMNGCDSIVFTGGIGENDPHQREISVELTLAISGK